MIVRQNTPNNNKNNKNKKSSGFKNNLIKRKGAKGKFEEPAMVSEVSEVEKETLDESESQKDLKDDVVRAEETTEPITEENDSKDAVNRNIKSPFGNRGISKRTKSTHKTKGKKDTVTKSNESPIVVFGSSLLLVILFGLIGVKAGGLLINILITSVIGG